LFISKRVLHMTTLFIVFILKHDLIDLFKVVAEV
jgi:hypothetical protein